MDQNQLHQHQQSQGHVQQQGGHQSLYRPQQHQQQQQQVSYPLTGYGCSWCSARRRSPLSLAPYPRPTFSPFSSFSLYSLPSLSLLSFSSPPIFFHSPFSLPLTSLPLISLPLISLPSPSHFSPSQAQQQAQLQMMQGQQMSPGQQMMQGGVQYMTMAQGAEVRAFLDISIEGPWVCVDG